MDILAAMRIFVRVVERGNMSRAARDLGIGQPAVSERINRLERHLGAKLLRRNTRVVSPTDEGTLFYERSKRAIEAAATLMYGDFEPVRLGAGVAVAAGVFVVLQLLLRRLVVRRIGA